MSTIRVITSPNFSCDLSARVRNRPFSTREFGDVITKLSTLHSIGIPQGTKDVTITAIGRDGQTVLCEVKLLSGAERPRFF
jgi:hypothetical protein